MKSSNYPAYRHVHNITTTSHEFPFRALLFTNDSSNKIVVTFTTTDINGQEDTIKVATKAESSFLFPFASTKISNITVGGGTLNTSVFVYALG
jgi:hypothetical protein